MRVEYGRRAARLPGVDTGDTEQGPGGRNRSGSGAEGHVESRADGPQRSDAQRNRERILEVALDDLRRVFPWF